ncbi:MAG: DUF3386 family protein, partial [Cyanobacteriota bacterium]
MQALVSNKSPGCGHCERCWPHVHHGRGSRSAKGPTPTCVWHRSFAYACRRDGGQPWAPRAPRLAFCFCLPCMTATLHAPIAPGTDLREVFRTTYENRYTWEPGFGGYGGR